MTLALGGKIKAERKKERFEKHFHSVDRVRFMGSRPCEITGKLCSVHNAHMKSRGAGGTYKHVVPLHFLAHKDFDEMGEEKFEKKYGRTKQSVRDRAEHYEELWGVYCSQKRGCSLAN